MHDSSDLRLASSERERLLAFEQTLLPLLKRHLLLLVAVLVVGANDFPARVVVAAGLSILIGGVVLFAVRLMLDRSPHPERWAMVEQVVVAGLLATMMSLTGGLAGPVAPLLFFNVLVGAARFDARLVRSLLLLVVVAMAAVAQLAAAPAQAAAPTLMLAWMGALVGATEVVRALVAAELRAKTRADHDGLTGLRNRGAMDRCLVDLAAQSQTTSAPVSLLLCDLDEFKAVNDSQGHAAGDAVLAKVAAALRAEIEGYDLIYRLGGDEFVVLLPGSNSPQAQAIGDRLAEAIRGAVGTYGVSASIGTATRSGVMVDQLLVEADTALYRAKRGGRDRVTAFAA